MRNCKTSWINRVNTLSDIDLIAKYLSVPPPIAAHILEHGLTPQTIARADIPKLSDPFGRPGILESVKNIDEVIKGRGSVTISCDKSADTIAAAATLLKALHAIRAKSSLSEEKGDLHINLGMRSQGDKTDIAICPASPPPSPAISVGVNNGIASLHAFFLAYALYLSQEKYFGKKLVAVDTETTGTNARSNEIIEIGAAVIEGNTVTETFQTLVNPGRKIPSEVVRITGITNDDIAGAPTPAAALSAFLEFIGAPDAAVLVAHNAEFDRDFIENGIKKYLKKKIHFETIDTLEMARRLYPAGSHRLAHVAEKLGIKVEGWHRALGDAVMAADIYFALNRRQNAGLRDIKLKQYMDTASLGIVASGKTLDNDCAIIIKNGLPKYRLDKCEDMISDIREKPDPKKIIGLLLARFFARHKNQLGAVTLLAPILKSGATIQEK